ncbi:glycosyltransferase involved in cell wall biosynthesis [Bradyrhizobium sp. LM3.2]
MRIAQVAPLTEAVPPKLYGGTERVVHWLTEELVALGHDVTLFASGDSQTSAKLDALWPRALRLDGSVRDPNALHMVMLERVRQKCDDEEFDFLHFHLDYYPWSLFYRQPTPFLTTLHGRLDLPRASAGLQHLFEGPRHLHLERAAAAGAAGELGKDDPPRSAGEPVDAEAGEAGISRRARPHRAGKGRRPRH